MKILILGANGMLGHRLFKEIWKCSEHEVYGTVRSDIYYKFFDNKMCKNIISNMDVINPNVLIEVLCRIRPEVVINCIGIIKQSSIANSHLDVLPINTIFPHRLAKVCELSESRLVHVSTDCVFNGSRGNYLETDFSNARDLYGRSKYLGEVSYSNALTIRTSIIGHELVGCVSLINWFLAQKGPIQGFANAYFSGLPTVVLANIIIKHILPREDLNGLWHVSAEKISKYDLLNIVKEVYDKDIVINKSLEYSIDRSLNSDRFRDVTGWRPQSWRDMIIQMFDNQMVN